MTNCEECRKDWTKCCTCHVMMQWLKDNKQEPRREHKQGMLVESEGEE